MDGKVFVCIVFAVFVMTYQTVHGRSLEDPLLTYSKPSRCEERLLLPSNVCTGNKKS